MERYGEKKKEDNLAIILKLITNFWSLLVDDVERPLVSDDANLTRDQSNDLTRNYDLEGACYQNEALLRPPRSEGLVHKQRIPSGSPHLAQGDSLVLDVISDPPEDILVGQTLKRPPATEHPVEVVKLGRPENQSENSIQEFVPQATSDQRIYFLTLSIKLGNGCLPSSACLLTSENTFQVVHELAYNSNYTLPAQHLDQIQCSPLQQEQMSQGSLSHSFTKSHVFFSSASISTSWHSSNSHFLIPQTQF
ncbi:hypothetical protein F3Y22_tig00002511pilonHSYRG00592 [Hibiscus syriacus]|uniref:Uncharacterized protein n=1 Tax=Hibiscus syriacus TaxID=106335 RepID=A0A6A3CX30_HIBSY|nr:hypothetical protein F3Y22_tig00002511pilonHSYRG00592 [Hibiscus syriacus]